MRFFLLVSFSFYILVKLRCSQLCFLASALSFASHFVFPFSYVYFTWQYLSVLFAFPFIAILFISYSICFVCLSFPEIFYPTLLHAMIDLGCVHECALFNLPCFKSHVYSKLLIIPINFSLASVPIAINHSFGRHISFDAHSWAVHKFCNRSNHWIYWDLSPPPKLFYFFLRSVFVSECLQRI